ILEEVFLRIDDELKGCLLCFFTCFWLEYKIVITCIDILAIQNIRILLHTKLKRIDLTNFLDYQKEGKENKKEQNQKGEFLVRRFQMDITFFLTEILVTTKCTAAGFEKKNTTTLEVAEIDLKLNKGQKPNNKKLKIYPNKVQAAIFQKEHNRKKMNYCIFELSIEICFSKRISKNKDKSAGLHHNGLKISEAIQIQ
ncbi:hypothetical protein ACJX0J_008000, partial [Zea mays]